MTWLLAIDPGPTESAWVELRDGRPFGFAKEPNHDVLSRVRHVRHSTPLPDRPDPRLAVEMVASYGMAVGAEVFATCVWAGRFIEAWVGGMSEDSVTRLYRKDVTLHLCHSRIAKDKNVRQALIDRYGPGKPAAVGLKASPGPLYGVSGDVWAALAVAVTAADQLAAEPLTLGGVVG